jgi:hypothetical protein
MLRAGLEERERKPVEYSEGVRTSIRWCCGIVEGCGSKGRDCSERGCTSTKFCRRMTRGVAGGVAFESFDVSNVESPEAQQQTFDKPEN